jgi:hypothetical protein
MKQMQIDPVAVNAHLARELAGAHQRLAVATVVAEALAAQVKEQAEEIERLKTEAGAGREQGAAQNQAREEQRWRMAT